MIADWLPNIHPLVVHFPIALLAVAVIFDLLRLVVRKHIGLNWSVLILYGLGTIGLMIAYITGQQATDTVEVAGQAFTVLTSHENWALATTIFFMIFFGMRFAAYWYQLDLRLSVTVISILLGLIGMGLVAITGDRGGELVFRHGVGVMAIEELQRELDEKTERLTELQETASPQVEENGSWSWRIVPGAENRIREDFSWLSGDPDAVRIRIERMEQDGKQELVFELDEDQDQEVFLVIEQDIGAVEGRIQMMPDEFDGQITLVHNIRDSDHYQYLRFDNGRIEQGQKLNADDRVLGDGETGRQGWLEMRVQASAGHFYGHINGEEIVHTHANQMDPGYTGLKLKGRGTFRLRQISFQAL